MKIDHLDTFGFCEDFSKNKKRTIVKKSDYNFKFNKVTNKNK